MFYLITDHNCNNYALLEGTKNNDIITHMYVHSITDDVWSCKLDFTALNRKLIIHRPLKDYIPQNFQLLFKATSMQELKWLIDRHPEVFI